MTAYQKAVGADLSMREDNPEAKSDLQVVSPPSDTISQGLNREYRLSCRLHGLLSAFNTVVNQVQSPSRRHDQIYDLKQSCSVGLNSIWGKNVRLNDEDSYTYRK